MNSSIRKGAARKLAGLCFALALAVGTCVPALAWADVPDNDYKAKGGSTYTITLYSGNVGELTTAAVASDGGGSVSCDGDKIEISGLQLGSSVSFNAQAGTIINDDVHYARGVRLSGHDNSTVSNSAIVVDGSQDYVVAYAIPDTLVEYTVYYTDRDGNQLLESETFHGNVGDEAVMGFRYVDGWAPIVSNIRMTLSDDPTQNVMAFVYDPIERPVVTIDGGTTTEETTIDNTTTTTEGGGATTVATTVGGGTAATPVAAATDATTAAADATTAAADAATTTLANNPNALASGTNPANEVTLDSGTNALASGQEGAASGNGISPLHTAGLVGIGAAAAAGIGALGYLFMKNRRKDEEQEQA